MIVTEPLLSALLEVSLPRNASLPEPAPSCFSCLALSPLWTMFNDPFPGGEGVGLFLGCQGKHCPSRGPLEQGRGRLGVGISLLNSPCWVLSGGTLVKGLT